MFTTHLEPTHLPQRIGIIGGGFCGTALLIQLVEQYRVQPIPKRSLAVLLLNDDHQYPLGKGIAFGSYNPAHVLNVPAAKMSVYPDRPTDFVEWLDKNPPTDSDSPTLTENTPPAFVSRVRYGAYLSARLNDALYHLPDGMTVETGNARATDAIHTDGIWRITYEQPANDNTTATTHYDVDSLVFALGNFMPATPSWVAHLAAEHPHIEQRAWYAPNPWKADALEGLQPEGDVLVVGTSLTMLDILTSLEQRANNGEEAHRFRGKVIALSSRGYLPLAHKPYTEDIAILSDLKTASGINELYHVFKKHIRRTMANGNSGYAVVDAIRPTSQKLWQSLTTNDRQRFMRHVRHLWGVARHRLPLEVHTFLMDCIKRQRIRIVGGRVVSAALEKDGGTRVVVGIKQRGSENIETVRVQRVINCTGPETRIQRIDSRLLQNLLQRGTIAPDALHLGINATPEGAVIAANGTTHPTLFAMGSLLKGIIWETTAVPELREQAKKLADELLRLH